MSGLLPDLASEIMGAYAQPSIRLALPYVMHGVSAGLSANSILKTLSDAGIGVRRTSGLALVRAMRTNYGYPAYVAGQMAADYPAANLFKMAAYPTRRRYTYVVRVEGTRAVSGEAGTQWISIASDSALDTQAWQDQAEAVALSGEMNYQLNPEKYYLEHVLSSPVPI